MRVFPHHTGGLNQEYAGHKMRSTDLDTTLLTCDAARTRFAMVSFCAEEGDLQGCSHIGTRIHNIRHSYTVGS